MRGFYWFLEQPCERGSPISGDGKDVPVKMEGSLGLGTLRDDGRRREKVRPNIRKRRGQGGVTREKVVVAVDSGWPGCLRPWGSYDVMSRLGRR